MLFRLATPLTLPLPSRGAWISYISSRFRAASIPVATEEIDDLLAFSGGHPRDLMELCDQLLTVRSLDRDVPEAIDLAKTRTMAGLSAEFDELWRRLERPKGTQTTAARIVTGQMVYGRGRPAQTTARTVTRLESLGLIRRISRGRYEFTEPLFGEFIRRRLDNPA